MTSTLRRSRTSSPQSNWLTRKPYGVTFWNALTLNGFAYSNAFGYDTVASIEALSAGALAAGLSGKGPAVAAVVPASKTKNVRSAWRHLEWPYPGNKIQLPEGDRSEGYGLNVTITPSSDNIRRDSCPTLESPHPSRPIRRPPLNWGHNHPESAFMRRYQSHVEFHHFPRCNPRIRKGKMGCKGQRPPRSPPHTIECGESGVTLRFTIPIATLTGSEIQFSCEESLARRPLQPLVESMRELGVEVRQNGKAINLRGGPPKGGRVHIRGDMSSQFISGLLFAGPLMRDGLELNLTSQLESRGYVSLTIQAMKRHGILVEYDDQLSLLKVRQAQTYKPATHLIPGDYSSAAFPIAAAAITSSKLLLRGLPEITWNLIP